MPQYSYRAVNDRGRSIRGTLAAANEFDLYQALKETGLELIDCRSVDSRRAAFMALRRVRPRDTVQLCIHLAELSRAGVPLLDGLTDIRDSTDSPVLRDTLSDIARDVSEGMPLSTAFAKHPRIFDNVFIALVSTGEQTGNLTEAFDHLAHHIKWSSETRAKVTKAARYPLFTLVVALAVMFFLMLLVVPQVLELLKATGQEMPFLTRALVAFSGFIASYWWAVVLGGLGLYAGVRTAARLSENFAFWLDGLWLQVPVVGPTVRKIALSRFAHFFAVTYKSGIEILKCLDSARNVVGNRTIAEAIALAQEAVRIGTPLSVALGSTGSFPTLVIRMVRVGEETGNLGETLEQITHFYDREVDEAIETMIGSIQPTLTFVIGGLIAWVVVAVLGPVYDNLSTLVT